MTEAPKRTPLHAAHLAAGGKMVPFAGFEMPVQYATGLLEEHKAVRERAGLFDVSRRWARSSSAGAAGAGLRSSRSS